MCCSLGLDNEEIAQAVYEQIRELPYAYPCSSTTPVKAKFSALLADMMPGDLKHFFFTGGGTESNESAVRMARLFTGKKKILTRYRSYHGATAMSASLTGDPRRYPAEPTDPNVVHLMDPYCYNFDWGTTSDDELVRRNLQYIQEVIEYEGPTQIAAIMIETITGTNGVLAPPKGYLNGLRAVCDKYNILLICDEVMCGFGRTGKLFGFLHSDPVIIPDMITMAKGINGAFIPLGCVAMRDRLADYFATHPTMIGSTYNSHPVALASAYAATKWCLKHKLYDHVKDMEPVMIECMNNLARKHRCFKQGRVLGLFGIFEVQKNAKGEWLVPYNGGSHPAMDKFKRALIDHGLITLCRWSQVYCVPPLVISEAELRESFRIIDECLTIVDDEAFEPAQH
eukprot:TRINITY_DN1677_c0_g1_i3.p1 TRINITY_DN1677_c0_g1~~TRINITY_DN1677_c0_g1_i3.p1  ORF type:complete len:397 (-),score=106.01 TRINITY_DN1677_c0_g1_i3:43-1233(-)